MEAVKLSGNVTFDVNYDDGQKKEVETGILIEFMKDNHINCHMGTSSAVHVFAAIEALEEMVHEAGLDDLFKKYRNIETK